MAVSSSASGRSWSAIHGPSSTNTLSIVIHIPVTAVIGRYKMSLQITSGGRPNVTSLGGFILLFNPWASGDEVYVSSEEERIEYVLNQTGLYWFGNVNSYGSRRWDYGQLEKDILNITLAVLDRSPEYKKDPATHVSRRNDPIYVGRILSAMVNSNDDNGVIVGNWSANYSGGERPTTWNGSAPILRQWMQKGPVKFGQCWVYAGVLCTVLRCLGIPARVIINFQSAHDTHVNLLIDEIYDEDGRKNEDETRDSIWNFHAWNEAYFTRKDLGSLYNGWQILDATPQERSDGRYQLGPTSQKAVKEGDVDKPYDTVFVFGEVNCDQAHWIKHKDGSKTLAYSEPTGVGQLTSTKAVGAFHRRDITNDYKYPEGSAKEREIFAKAKEKVEPPITVLMANEAATSDSSVPPKPEFYASFKKAAETQVGDDLKLSLTFKNTVAKSQKIKVNMTATAIIYNRKPVKDILTESHYVTLGPNEEKSIELTILYIQYRQAITPDNMIQTTAVCEDETGGKLLVQTVNTLKNPTLLLRASEDVKLNTTSQVDVIFTNPSQEEICNSVLIVEGSGLLSDQLIINSLMESPISNSELETTLKLTQAGKAPGPDGFSVTYYKRYLPILATPFLNALNSLYTAHAPPPDSLRAHITVIPKEGKDPSLCPSYRPISLLNIDTKLFAKILYLRLVPHLGDLIHPDQTGFIPSREARHNTTRALGRIHSARSSATPCVLLSTDVEKAFDRVDWWFLHSTLEVVGVGQHMRTWIGVLYSNPSALVTLNFPPLLSRIKSDLESWTKRTFSWMGRCNILKQSILPRLLYPLQALPIHIPPSFFRSIRTAFTEFVWIQKPPRLSYDILRRPKHSGGMSLPDVHQYYIATHLTGTATRPPSFGLP
ncbi:PREDICTED: protein-glutamine gamma-glutamyltransferase E-like [Nanorana parkeri]|uniref:protein-glutamine gamma-glutamyltransferase E-like n=1 Tax=Nanorana parkeri TaxID=125878 RepID=UPI00085486A7|nr:PREDICTED: protein-glutamine gamma-glutamyltransferase E-like [Nanorana parkeri]